MIESAGIVFIHDNKILLLHPTGSKWFGTYSFPKGHIEDGEDAIDAAIRETSEEIGVHIDFNKNDIIDSGYIDYSDKQSIVYKRVHYFVIDRDIDISQCVLQKNEVDWVGWLTLSEAQKRIFWRLKSVIQYLK